MPGENGDTSDGAGHGRDLRAVLRTYIRRHWPQDTAPARAHPTSNRQSRPSRALRLLRILPLVLSLLFVASFVWDFQGIMLDVLGRPLALEGLLLALSVGGFIGFFTNWLAITMLFHPRRRRPLLGIGVVPAQRDRIVERLANAVSEQLINEEVIRNRIESSGVVSRYRDVALEFSSNIVADPDFRADLKDITGRYLAGVLKSEPVQAKLVDITLQKLDEFSSSSFEGFALRTYRFVKEDRLREFITEAVQSLPASADAMVEHLDGLLDELPGRLTEKSAAMEQWASEAVLSFVRTLDTRAMVQDNLESYDEYQLESLIKGSTNDQLNYIKYLGGAFGIVGGLVIFDKWLAIPFLAVLVAAILLLDQIIYRLTET